MSAISKPLIFLLPILWLGSQLAQSQSTGLEAQEVCPDLLDRANASSKSSLSYQWSANGDDNGLGQWVVSVRTNISAESIQTATGSGNETNPDVSANVWLDPFVDVDLNNGDNPFSSCAYIIRSLPENTIRRGQDDDTSCEQMLSKSCVEEITWRASQTARWLVQNPTYGPFSNLTVSFLLHSPRQFTD